MYLRTGLYAVEKTNPWPAMDVNFSPLANQYLSYCTTLAIRILSCCNEVRPLVRMFMYAAIKASYLERPLKAIFLQCVLITH
jgi:hypothetical protein